jgi:hypothetical protein
VRERAIALRVVFGRGSSNGRRGSWIWRALQQGTLRGVSRPGGERTAKEVSSDKDRSASCQAEIGKSSSKGFGRSGQPAGESSSCSRAAVHAGAG